MAATLGDVLTALVFGVAFGAIPGAFGGMIVCVGWKRIRHGVTLLRSRPVSVEEVETADGMVELVGEVVAGDEQLASPVNGIDCVAYDYTVQLYSDDEDGDEGRWETVEEGSEAVPFLLDDGTGAVLVDPDDHELWISTGPPIEESDAPESIEDLVDRIELDLDDGLGVELDRGPRRRYTEGQVEEGERVHVFGPLDHDPAATEAGSDVEAAVRDGDGEEIHISDTGQWGAVGRQFVMGLVITAVGVPFLLIGIGLPVLMMASALGLL